MKKELKELFPKWATEKQEGYALMGTDDLDSQGSISLLNQIFGYEQNCYVTRNGVYVINKAQKKHIGVDLACIHNRMTYDNHVTMIDKNSSVNQLSANVNAVKKIDRNDYAKKCAFSTMLQLYSLFDIPLPKTDEGKMFLLSIDSSHLGHYSDYFKSIHNNWLEQLDLTELIDILNKYSKDEISSMRKDEKLSFENGQLTYNAEYKAHAEKLLGYELYLPKGEFTQIARLQHNYKSIDTLSTDITRDKRVFSMALVNKNKVCYSVIDKIYK